MTNESQQDEALAWLASRLRWERLLTELNSRTTATDQPVEPLEPVAARAA
jgi:hypothetical protein